MPHQFVFAPEAEAQLLAVYRYISQTASADIAEGFTSAIIAHCEGLATFPSRGAPRDDIQRGLRTIPFRRRVTIAYAVIADQVSILGIYYAGQNWEADWGEQVDQ